jgi:hypothetical protein
MGHDGFAIRDFSTRYDSGVVVAAHESFLAVRSFHFGQDSFGFCQNFPYKIYISFASPNWHI